MRILDLQLHDPARWMDWTASDPQTQDHVCCEILLAHLDALGISGAVIFSDRWGAVAARAHPSRLAYVPDFSHDVADVEAAVADAKAKRAEGLLALRAMIGWPHDGSEAKRVEQGERDSFFQACEEHGVPLFVFVTGFFPVVAGIAARHPDLQLIIDHLGLRQPPMGTVDSPPFKDLPQVLALAEFPNVAMKVCGFPALSSEPYPFSDVVPHLRSMVDAFGADRLMWASDIYRFYGRIGTSTIPRALADYPGKHTYAESLNFILHCEQLSTAEKEALLGGTLCTLFGWPNDPPIHE